MNKETSTKSFHTLTYLQVQNHHCWVGDNASQHLLITVQVCKTVMVTIYARLAEKFIG